MGQSATLYRINQVDFERLKKEPTSFIPQMTEGHATFEQNFEGLLFLLSKFCTTSEQALVQEIFYPSDLVRENIDAVRSAVLDDISFPEMDSISYLNQEKINSINKFLNTIDKRQLLNSYDPKELNANGVYPCVWHNNDSLDQAFNRRHIEEGFDMLVNLFSDAVKNKSLVLSFVG